MTVIRCKVPEIWSAMDRMYCQFGPSFALPPPNLPNNPKNQNFDKMKKMPGNIIVYMIVNIIVYHKWQSYDVWFLRNGA